MKLTSGRGKTLPCKFLVSHACLILGLTAAAASAQPDPLLPNTFGTCSASQNGICDTSNDLCATFNPQPTGQGTCDSCGQVRYISFEIPGTSAGSDTAIRVKLSSLHHPPAPFLPPPSFAVFEGQYQYLNTILGTAPRCCDPTSNPTKCEPSFTCASDADCAGSAPNTRCEKNLCADSASLSTFFRCARVGCNPEYRDWSDFSGLVTYANGNLIAPSSVYAIAHLAESCAGNEVGCAAVSAEIQVQTEGWPTWIAAMPTPASPRRPTSAESLTRCAIYRGLSSNHARNCAKQSQIP